MVRKHRIGEKRGEGWMDTLKSVAKAVAPLAINEGAKALKSYAPGASPLVDVGASMAKKGVAGMGFFGGDKTKAYLSRIVKHTGEEPPVEIRADLSPSQVSSLRNGGMITLHPKHTHHTGRYILHLHRPKAIRLLKAHGKGKGMRMKMEHGEGFFDTIKKVVSNPIVKSVVKAAAPYAIDAGAQALKSYVPVASPLIDIGAKEAKKGVAGYGLRKYHRGGMIVKPILDAEGDAVPIRELMYSGGALRGHNPMRSMDDIDKPIQLGSPYIKTASPSFQPFFNNKGIQSYNPIEKRGGSFLPGGTGIRCY